jgi:predicted RNase H-like HicB family nuclease
MNSYTAIIQKSGSWWIGWIAEVQGVNCQERTKAKLLESLQETLGEAIDFLAKKICKDLGISPVK